jgi:leader peptidase (prepilin peptidase)/N-methyltransferase
MAASPWYLPMLLAPFVGSFVGVVSARFERPLTILFGRSACPGCRRPLGVPDLVPLLSWLVAGGCCRHCGGTISLRYPAIECAAIVIAAWAAAAAPAESLWASVVLGWGLLALVVTDLESYTLPDFLTLPLLIVGLGEAWGWGDTALADRGLGAFCGIGFILLVRFVYWRVRRVEGIGLGDAKLLGVAGAWIGWEGLPTVLFLAAVSALLVVPLRTRRFGKVSLTERVPFGAYLCFATWVVWLHGPLGLVD